MPAHLRSKVADIGLCECSLKEGFIVVGILLGYLASSQFIDSVGGWRYMYGLSLLPAVLLGAGMVSELNLQTTPEPNPPLPPPPPPPSLSSPRLLFLTCIQLVKQGLLTGNVCHLRRRHDQ